MVVPLDELYSQYQMSNEKKKAPQGGNRFRLVPVYHGVSQLLWAWLAPVRKLLTFKADVGFLLPSLPLELNAEFVLSVLRFRRRSASPFMMLMNSRELMFSKGSRVACRLTSAM